MTYKHLIAVIALSISCSGAAVIQHVPSHDYSSASTVSCAVTATGASRGLIIGTVEAGNAAISVSSVTDDKGNSYTLATGSKGTDSTDFLDTEVWHSLGAISGVQTITAHFTTSTTTYYKAIFCYEVSGIALFDLAGKVDRGTCSAGICSGSSVSTTGATEFVLGVAFPWFPVDQNPASGEFVSGGDFDINSGDHFGLNFNIGNSAAAALVSVSASAHTPVWHVIGGSPPFTSSTSAYK